VYGTVSTQLQRRVRALCVSCARGGERGHGASRGWVVACLDAAPVALGRMAIGDEEDVLGDVPVKEGVTGV
jgi:hypothetical protein